METRNVEVSLAKAREWYKSDNKALKEVALQAFTKEELEDKDYESILNFDDACTALGLSLTEEYAAIMKLKSISVHAAAVYMLDIVRKALNSGETPSLVSGNIYYPFVRFYRISETPSASDLKNNGWILGDIFKHNGTRYILVGGDCGCYIDRGVGCFGYGFWSVYAAAGLLCCKSREIAQHMSKYFSRLIFDVMYSQYNLVDWEE